jgi:quercetin dioxygenase-like cupin family protein
MESLAFVAGRMSVVYAIDGNGMWKKAPFAAGMARAGEAGAIYDLTATTPMHLVEFLYLPVGSASDTFAPIIAKLGAAVAPPQGKRRALFDAKQLAGASLELVELERDTRLERKTSNDAYEAHYLLSGAMRARVDGVGLSAGKGAALFIPRGKAHEAEFPAGTRYLRFRAPLH